MGHLADGATLPLAERLPALIELRPEALWPLNTSQDYTLRGENSRHAGTKTSTSISATTPAAGRALPLQATLGQCQSAAREVSDQLCSLFFTHSGEARYSVGA
jgi:hypothetical protein